MTEEPLRCRVLQRFPVALVDVDGSLRQDTAPALRIAVLKALAEEPVAVVLDLADAVPELRVHATVVLALAHHVAATSAAVLLVAAPSPEMRAALRSLGPLSDVEVHPTLPDALRAAARRPVPRRFHARVPAGPDAPRVARELVAEACRTWVLDPLRRDRAVQIASELVTNAVQHAAPPYVLRVRRRPPYLVLELEDGADAVPRVGGGLGLQVVDELAASWGVRAVPGGKVVWATLRLRPLPRRRPEERSR